uniref:sensor domain-containing diguanylate cyclase n=1 Tax=Aliarcobacter sp. TaxID=2321116 RepID=UPI004047154D
MNKNEEITINHLKQTLDNIPSYVYIKNKNSKYIYANKLTLQLFNCLEEELIGRSDFDFFPSALASYLREVDLKVLSGLNNEEEIVVDNSDGSKTTYLEIKSPILSSNNPNEIIGLLGISTDISKMKQLEVELIKSSNTDPLTNLNNRKYYNETILKLIGLFNRYKTPFTFVIFDIDNFKQINDKYGHNEGDNVLINLSNFIKFHIRENDYIFRIGGEEFVILLSNTNIDNGKQLCKNICEGVSKSKDILKTKRITISIGATEIKENDSTDSIFKRADSLLYNAKNNGKNRVEIG